MNVKCQKCFGKGGWFVRVGRFEVFQSCIECRGKGRWFPNKRPKQKVKQ